MIYYGLNFFKTKTHDTINDLARDLALFAHSLLGEVDNLWTQQVLDGCVNMSFLRQCDGEMFRERWMSLNEAEWYMTCASYSANGGEDRVGPTPSVTPRHSEVIYISWASQSAEGDQIRDALTAGGFAGARDFDLTDISMQSKLSTLDRLAAKFGIKGFTCDELEEDSENQQTPILLSCIDRSQLAAFKLAIEAAGGI